METLMEWILGWIMSLAQTNPHVAVMFMIMGALRAVFKPLMSAWAGYVEYTDSKEDDKKFQEFKSGKFYKFLCWLLDFTASIKVKNKR
jgi:hypothetical protein